MAASDDRLDAMMLKSMATALRADLPFSFNRIDMAELLERAADRIKPKPAAVAARSNGEGESDG